MIRFVTLSRFKHCALALAVLAAFSIGEVNTARADNNCPGYTSQNAKCGEKFRLKPSIPVMAYCGQGGSSCCTCDTIRTGLQQEMDYHRKGGGGKDSFLFKTYWNNTVNPGLQAFLSKILQTIVAQTASRGGFLTAQDNIASISALQQGAAEAARNYMPSESLCRYGSLSQGLGADDVKRRFTQTNIATVGLKRSLGSEGSVSKSGRAGDVTARMNEFIKEYCNPGLGGLVSMCGSNSARRFPALAKDTRYNKDINYTRTIDSDATLDIDIADKPGGDSAAKQDVLALASNLYGSSQMTNRFTKKQMNDAGAQNVYLKTRSVAASRSVVENTYAAIAAMKARGSGGSLEFMKALLAQLGIGTEQTGTALSTQPSYYAQMDILTKKLYQDPSFYINLMEGKTNVARQSGAMEGIEVMQDRDIYQSMRRSEMLLALMIQLQSDKELSDAAEDLATKKNND